MAEAVAVRPLSSLEDVRAAAALFDRIWQERRVMGAPLLRAMATHGGQVLGAFEGNELVGALVGLVGLTEDGRNVLHSHITGVAPETQHRGVGFLLKRAQRDWCQARGIEEVTWTMDPMVARNARFNLHKLGAVGAAFYRDYYGPMEDAFNRGERSDRLEIRWDLHSERGAGRRRAAPGPPPAEAAVHHLVRDQRGQGVRAGTSDRERRRRGVGRVHGHGGPPLLGRVERRRVAGPQGPPDPGGVGRAPVRDPGASDGRGGAGGGAGRPRAAVEGRLAGEAPRRGSRPGAVRGERGDRGSHRRPPGGGVGVRGRRVPAGGGGERDRGGRRGGPGGGGG